MSTHILKSAATATMLIAVLFLATSLRPSSTSGTPSTQSIDRIIGAGGFNVIFPIRSGPGQIEQITARLAYIEHLLRSRDVSAWPAPLRAERARNIDRLREYRLRGIYPRNEDHPDKPLPCFIDNHGAICAVGYLVEQSAGRDVAEWINQRYQYATVAEMDSPALTAWIARSGLTKAEVMTIQEPGWRGNRSGLSQEIVLQSARMTQPIRGAFTNDTSHVSRSVPASVAPVGERTSSHATGMLATGNIADDRR